jgi:acetyl-CoA synthetase
MRPEDLVCLFLNRIPELFFSFLGILKIEAIVQPLFSAFGDETLYARLKDAGTRAVITQRKYLPMLRRIRNKLPGLEFIIVIDTLINSKLEDKEYKFTLKSGNAIENLEIFPARSESPSLLHYTSGTTGQPKGVGNTHYSLISQFLTAKKVLDLRDEDICWCTADPGWVTGTSYGIIGPWRLGIAQCVLDSGFSAQKWFRFIEKYKVSMWYSDPTAIRSLMKVGDEVIKNFDLSSLRHLASVEEPLNAEAVIWSGRVFGKPFRDTYWQAEIGSIMIANFPEMKIKPGSMGKPCTGITAVIPDPVTYKPLIKQVEIGLIAFKPSWPSMIRNYWNNPKKYSEKFFNGWYLTGDKGRIDNDGYFWFIVKDDDVINRGWHLVSPFEVESVLLEHPPVGESLWWQNLMN